MGIAFAIVIFLVFRKVSRKTLFKTSNILSLICIVAVISSIVIIGGWEGMGVGTVAICIFIGIWMGTVLGVINKT